MTQNEVDIIKNAVLDATEAYVDARLGTAAFVKTQIGVVVSAAQNTQKKWVHKVRCNQTSNTQGIIYDNVLSVNNIHFTNGSTVFILAPNAQFSNQFILGKLDNVPYDIVGGSINIGDGKFKVASNGDVECNGKITCKNIIANEEGSIGGFKITQNSLGDELGSSDAVGMISGDHLYAVSYSSGSVFHGVKIRTDEIEMFQAMISVNDGNSWIHINGHQVQANDKGYVVWHSEWNNSDKRLKKDIIDLDLETSKNFINNLSPKQYEFIPNETKNLSEGKRYGFIAQDVEKITGGDFNIVYDDDDKYKHLNYSDIIAPLVKVVQNQQKEIENLKSKLGVK